MKKYYGVIKSDFYNQIRNKFYQFAAFTRGYIRLGKVNRINERKSYHFIYEEKMSPIKHDNSILDGKYYRPVCFIAHDIIPKEYLEEFSRNLQKLLKRHMFGNHTIIFEDDRIKSNVSIDKHVWNYDSWNEIGSIDFKNDRILSNHIKYVQLKTLNVSVSYFALQVEVYLSPERQAEIEEVVNSNYDLDKYHTSLFLSSKKNGGARTRWTLTRYNQDHMKSEAVDAMMIETKWFLFNKLSKWFRLQLHGNGIMPPSVNIYKTDIHYSNEAATRFFYSVGLKKFDGEFLRENAKIFFDIDRSYGNRSMYQDFVYVVNEETEEKQDMYVSFDHQITTEFEELYTKIFRFRIADYIGVYYHSVYSKYRNIVKSMKSNKTSRRRVLKNIYKFESDFAMFDRIFTEIKWKIEEKKVHKYFPEKEKIENVRPCFGNFTTIDYASRVTKDLSMISENKTQILDELQRKSDLIKHKRDFENENRNFAISVVMLMITLLTFMVVIFDGLAKPLSTFIVNSWGWISDNYIITLVAVSTLLLIFIWNRWQR